MPWRYKEQLRVLLVEDDQAYARLLRELLHDAGKDQYEVTHVISIADACEHLGDGRVFDVILLDLGLPDGEGVDSVISMRARASRCPIVVLSGVDDLDIALQAMRNGAQEYLVKGQSEEHLLPRTIRYAIERRRMQDFEQLLIGVASHDLRGPMQTIALACDLLELQLEEDGARKNLERARRASERATALIGDLLDATRIRVGGRLPVMRERQDVVAIVSQVVDEARGAHPDRDIQLRTPDRAEADVDASRLGQTIGNLLGNALQHSPDGTPVAVAVERGETEVAISVHNHGDPIPQTLRARLFEPLERAQLRKYETNRSIGLGLYIVREIVRAHAGTISVASETGQGTTFRVTLPCASGAATP